MRLEHPPVAEKYKSYPGVYSTSFAVQLLCKNSRPEEDNSRIAIISGIDYLVSQYCDSKLIGQDGELACKQASKLLEIGHHDFSLTLKLCSILQASNALAKVVHSHPDFSAAMSRHSAILDEIATRLKETGQSSTSGQRAEFGWPWHSLGGGEVDPIPTCQVLLTLTDEAARGTTRWLSEYQQTVSYLTSVLEKNSAPLIYRVTVGMALLEVEARTKSNFISEKERARLISDLTEAMKDLPNQPWQEVVHFQVPSSKGTLSHYKPWIWTFPRIEFALCYSMLDPKVSKHAVFMVAAQLVENIDANDGKVVFFRSAPPTLLASLSAANFLEIFFKNNLTTSIGKLSFIKERLLLRIFGYLEMHPNFLFMAFFTVLMALVAPHKSNFNFQSQSINDSLGIIKNTTKSLFPFWPLWLIFILFLMVMHQGPFLKRIRPVIKDFIQTVIIRFLLAYVPVIK